MKKIILSLISLTLIISVTSCQGFLDVNKNPNYVTEAGNDFLLVSSQLSLAGSVGGEMQLVGSLWMQYYTQNNTSNQYKTTCQYNMSTGSYETRFFTNPYTMTLNDLKILINQATEKNEPQYMMVGKLLTAYTFYLVTSIYGDIPFTDALQGSENFAPKYDDAKTVVQPGIIALIDEALALSSAAAAAPRIGSATSSPDYLFNGDIAKWIQFGNTLKLKMLMRDFDVNLSEINSLIAGGGLLTSDAGFIDKFTDAENSSYPLYEYNIRKMNTATNLAANATMVEFLKHYDDPRVTVFFNPIPETGVNLNYMKLDDKGEVIPQPDNKYMRYCGAASGWWDEASPVGSYAQSLGTLGATDDLYFISLAETQFLIAECYARQGNAARAKEYYDLAVQSAFHRWNLDGTSFIAPGGAYEFVSGSTEQMMSQIITQKWIAGCRSQAIEAWFDRNRTGYPTIATTNATPYPEYSPEYLPGYVLGTLVQVKGAAIQATEYPFRFMVPAQSDTYNPNAPAESGRITDKLWWHK